LVGWLKVRVFNCFTSCFNQYEFIVKVVVIIELFNVNVIMEVFIVSVSMEEFIALVIVIVVVILID